MAFDNVVFAGGGNRCFWQAGFWHSVASEIDLQPRTIASVSAGSAISCALFSGNFERTLETTKRIMSGNPKNRYWKNLFTDKRVHPHPDLYRKIVLDSVNEQGLQNIKNGPENRILVAHIPKWLGPRSAVLVGLGAYQLEKKIRQPVHPSFGRRLGFRSEFISVSECETVEQLVDVMISSSCTPPFTPLMYRNSQPVLDGGMVDNVPVHGVENEPGSTLILLSRPYKTLPQIPNRVYAQPSKPVPVSSWDYTSPDLVQLTYEQGLQDGLKFLQKHKD